MSETASETGTTTTETGAPAGTETTETTTTTAPAGTEGAETTTEGGEDSRVKRANAEAAKYRTDLRAAQQQLADAQAQTQAMLAGIAKAAGLAPDEGTEADPAAQVGTLTTQVETLTNRTAQLEAELLVHTLAADPALAANPVKLLDSRSFTTALYGLDPAAEDYRTKVAEAIKTAVESDASLQAGGGQVPPSRGGAPEAGQGAGDEAGAVTAEQFKAMSYAERTALFRTNPALYRRLSAE